MRGACADACADLTRQSRPCGCAIAELDARDARGRTPLHLAALAPTTVATERLVAAGADVNARDARGCSPLRLAARHGALAQLRALAASRSHAIDVDAPCDAEGLSPLHVAAFFGHFELARALMCVRLCCARVLWRAGSPRRRSDPHKAQLNVRYAPLNRSPLAVAVLRRQHEIVSLLVKHGATLFENETREMASLLDEFKELSRAST